jgi:hypothetical protein
MTHWIENVGWYVTARKKVFFLQRIDKKSIAPDTVAVLTELIWLMSLNKLI